MTTSLRFTGIIFALFVTALFCAYVMRADIAKGSAAPGIAATIASSSNPTVNTTASTVIGTSTNCAARVIATASSSIMSTFTDKQGNVPSATLGFPQAASTTQSYPSEIYGCGALKIYSFGTQSITVLESY